MAANIALSDELSKRLQALAAQRGETIAEVIDAALARLEVASLSTGPHTRADAVALSAEEVAERARLIDEIRGSISDDEAEHMREVVRELRSNWR